MVKSRKATLLQTNLDSAKKSKINSGLNDGLKDTFEDGFYLVNGQKFTCEELTGEAAWNKHKEGNQLVKIDARVAEKLEIISNVSKKDLDTYLSALHAGAKAEASASKKSKIGNSELEAAAKAYAQVGQSLTGLYAQVGAGAEAKISIKGKIFEFEARAFAEAKAGVSYGMLGASAKAEAEVGIEDKLTANVKEFTLESGTKVSLKVFACLKAFAKAEAFAGLGGMTGAEAGANIGVEGKVGASISRKRKTDDDFVTAGEASIAITLKIGLSIGGKAGIDLNEIVEDGNPYIEFKHAASFSLLAGGEYEIAVKVLTDVFNEAKDELIKLMDKEVRDEVLKYLEEQFDEVMEELEFHVKDAAKKIQRGWDNTQNFGKKLLIAIEDGLGNHNEAMKDEIERQVAKLEQYKQELTNVIKKLEKSGYDAAGIEAVKNEVSDPEFEKNVNKWFGPKITDKDIKKELMLDMQRYERRIVKLNEFLDSSYNKTIASVKKLLSDLSAMVNGFNSKDIPSNFTSSDDFKKMVKKIKEIQNMIGTIDNIIANKKKLVKEVKGDSNLHAVINTMTAQYKQIKKDFFNFYSILSNYVKGLPR